MRPSLSHTEFWTQVNPASRDAVERILEPETSVAPGRMVVWVAAPMATLYHAYYLTVLREMLVACPGLEARILLVERVQGAEPEREADEEKLFRGLARAILRDHEGRVQLRSLRHQPSAWRAALQALHALEFTEESFGQVAGTSMMKVRPTFGNAYAVLMQYPMAALWGPLTGERGADLIVAGADKEDVYRLMRERLCEARQRAPQQSAEALSAARDVELLSFQRLLPGELKDELLLPLIRIWGTPPAVREEHLRILGPLYEKTRKQLWDLVDYVRRKGLGLQPGTGPGVGGEGEFSRRLSQEFEEWRRHMANAGGHLPEAVEGPVIDVSLAQAQEFGEVLEMLEKGGAEYIWAVHGLSRTYPHEVERKLGQLNMRPLTKQGVDRLAKTLSSFPRPDGAPPPLMEVEKTAEKDFLRATPSMLRLDLNIASIRRYLVQQGKLRDGTGPPVSPTHDWQDLIEALDQEKARFSKASFVAVVGSTVDPGWKRKRTADVDLLVVVPPDDPLAVDEAREASDAIAARFRAMGFESQPEYLMGPVRHEPTRAPVLLVHLLLLTSSDLSRVHARLRHAWATRNIPLKGQNPWSDEHRRRPSAKEVLEGHYGLKACREGLARERFPCCRWERQGTGWTKLNSEFSYMERPYQRLEVYTYAAIHAVLDTEPLLPADPGGPEALRRKHFQHWESLANLRESVAAGTIAPSHLTPERLRQVQQWALETLDACIQLLSQRT